MTTYSTIADSEIDPESPYTTGLATKMRNNPIAITEGSSGAPKIQTAAMAEFTSNSISHKYAVAPLAVSAPDQASYVKMYEVYMPRSGTVNVVFTLATSVGTHTTFGRIRIGDVAVGTERSTTSLTPVEYKEDIAVIAGQRLQLYMKQSATGATMSSAGFGIGANEFVDSITRDS